MPTTQETVNGINTGALRSMVDDVAADQSKGIAKFQVSTRWTERTKSKTRVSEWALGGRTLPRDFSIATDEPCELLGDGAAPNPQEVLMAGLNACMTVGYVAGCAMKGIELESLEIETEGELDLRGFLGLDEKIKPGYDELRYTVRIKGDGTPAQFEDVHRTVMATSPNFWNMAHPVKLVPTLIVEPQ